MSDWPIPSGIASLTPSAKSVLLYCLINADNDAPYLVRGGVKVIALDLGLHPAGMCRIFDNIDEHTPGAIQRIGRTRSRAVRVSLPTPGLTKGCAVCGDLPLHLSSDCCGSHFQTHVRKDRSWKLWALDIYVRGEARNDTHMKIAYATHTKTGQPLFGRSEEGESGSGSGAGEGVIPFFVSVGLMPESMLKYGKRAKQGGGSYED